MTERDRAEAELRAAAFKLAALTSYDQVVAILRAVAEEFARRG
jgi:hypothetical protein